MTKTYCDYCKQVINDKPWKMTIEVICGCISDLVPTGKHVYDLCTKCAIVMQKSVEQPNNLAVER